MRNIQNIHIRYGSGVPVPCDLNDFTKSIVRALQGQNGKSLFTREEIELQTDKK